MGGTGEVQAVLGYQEELWAILGSAGIVLKGSRQQQGALGSTGGTLGACLGPAGCTGGHWEGLKAVLGGGGSNRGIEGLQMAAGGCGEFWVALGARQGLQAALGAPGEAGGGTGQLARGCRWRCEGSSG